MNYQWRGEIETHITTLLPLEGPTNDQLRQGLSTIKTSTYVIDDHNYALTFYINGAFRKSSLNLDRSEFHITIQLPLDPMWNQKCNKELSMV